MEAAGAGCIAGPDDAEATGADAAGAAAAAGLASSFFGAGAEPAPEIWPSSAFTSTVSPSCATISARTPAAAAGTSIVTLSVSSSTSGSSAAIASPTFLNHFPMVASVTDSPSVGTRISVAMVSSSVDLQTLDFVFNSGWSSSEKLLQSSNPDQLPSASSRKAASCARCFDIRPVAGEAAAGRPA
ncbi:hypothetical protein D3C80_1406980 [compost metagenome]